MALLVVVVADAGMCSKVELEFDSKLSLPTTIGNGSDICNGNDDDGVDVYDDVGNRCASLLASIALVEVECEVDGSDCDLHCTVVKSFRNS